MSEGFLYDLAMALIPGTIAGYYSGLLTAKYAKFSSLKSEALRCVRGVSCVGDGRGTSLLDAEKVPDLYLIASELLFLKHRRAGEALSELSGEASNLVASCKLTNVPFQKFDDAQSNWQVRIRALRPGLNFFLPWGQL